MKHGRKLTRSEKISLIRDGLDPNVYLRIKRTADDFQVVNVETSETRWVRRG